MYLPSSKFSLYTTLKKYPRFWSSNLVPACRDITKGEVSHVRFVFLGQPRFCGRSIGSLLVTRMYGEPFIMYGLSNGPDRGAAERTSRTRCREHSFSSSLCYARVCGGSELRSRFDAHSVAQFWFALEMTQALRTKSPEPERQTVSRHTTSSAIRSCIRPPPLGPVPSFFYRGGWLQNENGTWISRENRGENDRRPFRRKARLYHVQGSLSLFRHVQLHRSKRRGFVTAHTGATVAMTAL